MPLVLILLLRSFILLHLTTYLTKYCARLFTCSKAKVNLNLALTKMVSTKKSSNILSMGWSFKFVSVLCFMDVADAYAKLPNGNGETEASKRVGSFGGVIDDIFDVFLRDSNTRFLRYPNIECRASQAELSNARTGGYGVSTYLDHDPKLYKYNLYVPKTLVECKNLCIADSHCKAIEFYDKGTYTTSAKRCELFYACSKVDVAWSGGTSYVMQPDYTKRSLAIKKYGPIEQWILSQVTNMKNAFYRKFLFNSDISRWEVSAVTDMHGSK